ncbi:hypothetical protein GGI12_003745 [Dipsacomyces acuminosporus]|nr:hypothetical protein GGI12_003745 [Dipsacomyces acuminosporus]
MARSLGIKLDPIGYVDLSTIVVISSIYSIEFIALCYQFWNRKYPPLKVKNIPLMVSLFVFAILWFLGDIFTGGLVHLYPSPLLRSCKATIIWFRACLGAYSVTSMFTLRIYSLYRVFYLNKPFKGKVVYVSFAATFASIILFAIISTFVPSKLTTRYEKTLDMCFTTTHYIVAVLVVIWSIWLFAGYMSWKMRNIAFNFNEKVEMLSVFILLFIVSTMNTVCLLVIRIYPAYLAWRTSLLYVNHACASIGYWIIMWEPTYQCLFHRNEYLQYWIEIFNEEYDDGGDANEHICTSYSTNHVNDTKDKLMESGNVKGKMTMNDSTLVEQTVYESPSHSKTPNESTYRNMDTSNNTCYIPETVSELCLTKAIKH